MPEDKLKVWRVRLRDADHGPFFDYNFAMAFDERMGVAAFPNPWTEGVSPGPNDVCGCRTLSQLRTWFGRRWIVDQLEALDTQLVRVVVPKEAARITQHQVIFDRTKAQPDGVWPVRNILLPQHSWGTL